MSEDISGKIALITGASSGIGQATAVALAGDGVKVALMARRKEKLEEIQNQITESGGSCLVVQADVTDRQQVEQAVEIVQSEWGPVDILINNAGVFNGSPMKNLRVDDWLQVVDVNVKGVLHCIGATLGPMVEKGSGHVINISSIGGKQAQTQLVQAAPYFGSKFFLQGFTSGMRQELASKGIKVCTVCPGGVLTEIFQKIGDPEVQETVQKNFGDDFEKMIENEMILKSEDIAETISFILKQPSRIAINDVVVEPRAMSCV